MRGQGSPSYFILIISLALLPNIRLVHVRACAAIGIWGLFFIPLFIPPVLPIPTAQALQTIGVAQPARIGEGRGVVQFTDLESHPVSQDRALDREEDRRSETSSPPVGYGSIRLRISWGGGSPQQWKGQILNTAESEFVDHALLSMNGEVGAAVLCDRHRIVIDDWSEGTFGGIDVTVNFLPQATLQIELGNQQGEGVEIRDQIDIQELIHRKYVRQLDPTGNRLVISRLPSDRVSLNIDRSHLVFAPGADFEFGFQVNYSGHPSTRFNGRLKLKEVTATNPAGSGSGGQRLTAMLSSGSGTRNQTIDLGSLELDREGNSASQQVRVKVPDQEGVYLLTIELSPTWQQVSARAALQRSIEIVVLSHQSPSDQKKSEREAPWKRLTKVNLAGTDPQWLTSWRNVARKTGLAADDRNNWQGGATPSKRWVGDEEMLELPPGSWQAIPLVTEYVDRPHYVDIEYLSGQPMSLGISILEGDAEGQIPFYGVDSGLHIPNFLVDPSGEGDLRKKKKHRIYFWPQQRESYLLIANRDRKQVAVLGEVELFHGPSRLPPLPIQQRESHSDMVVGDPGRQFLAFYESPLFFRNFGARQVIDETTGQWLDNWSTFYLGADRLIQYLKAHGYSGAMINVASEGSALYPSPHFSNSPKLDNGIFFSNGQDPLRKDVVELLYRMFEREGLTLVPLLVLASPLPELELRRLQQPTLAQEINLISLNGSAPSRQLKHHLPIYNPLSEAVQQIVEDEIEQFSRRYGSHPSFAGLGIICRPDSYGHLPGQQWGYDQPSIQTFLSTLSPNTPKPDHWSEVQYLLTEVYSDAWLQWRVSAMAKWYQGMLAKIQSVSPNARLFIAPVDLYRNEEMQISLVPSLHSSTDFRRQMLKLGWTTELFSATPGLELLKPRRLAPNSSLTSNRVELGLENQRQVDDFFLQANSIGDIYSHRNSWAHFAELQQYPPFQQQRGTLMRLQPLVPAAEWSVVRFLNSFRAADPNYLVDGGWMLPVGQESETHDFIQQFRQLPTGPFQDVAIKSTETRIPTPPIIVRQLPNQQATWFYVVNPTPWPINTAINFRRSSEPSSEFGDLAINSFSNKLSSPQWEESRQQIYLRLPPFSFHACRSNQPIDLLDFGCELPDNGADRLRKQVYLLQTKLTAATGAKPVNLLTNAGFELEAPQSNGLEGWSLSVHDQATAKLVSADAAEGKQYLEIRNHSNSPVWIRSHPIRVPETGRLTVSMWLRTSQPHAQPPLRIAIDGTYADSQYYRFGSVGALAANSKVSQLSEDWQRFVVHFDDLPVEGIGDLRVGLDLMGEGQLQVDQVELYDRWFDDRDAKAISQRLASCGPLLSNPLTFESGRQLLSSYWMRFLDDHFFSAELIAKSEKDERQSADPQTVPSIQSAEKMESSQEGQDRNLFRRFRRSTNRR